MNIKKNKNQFIISIIVGVIIFALSFQVLSRQQEQINELKQAKPAAPQAEVTMNKYVFTNSEVKQGTVIAESNIKLKEIPVKVEGGFSDPREVIGLVIIKDIKEDQPLTREYFSEDDMPTGVEPKKGYRAVSIATENKSYVPPIKPMTFVDIYSTGGSIVIENVLVLDIKRDSKAGKVVVLEIKDNNVSDLVKVIAENKEKFMMVLKNQNDDRVYKFSYTPQLSELEKFHRGALADIAPPSSVTNYNIEEFVINEAPKAYETVEVIRGTNKTECEF